MLTICQMSCTYSILKPEWATSKGSQRKFVICPQWPLRRWDISIDFAIHIETMSHFNYSTPLLKLACTPSSCHSSNLGSILQQIKRIYSKLTHTAHVTLCFGVIAIIGGALRSSKFTLFGCLDLQAGAWDNPTHRMSCLPFQMCCRFVASFTLVLCVVPANRIR